MKKVILLLLVTTFLYSCGYQEGIVQKAEKSYLKFSGNIENASVQIDSMEPFTIPENKIYQLMPGKYSLKIYRKGNLVVDKILFLENQTTMEVIIP